MTNATIGGPALDIQLPTLYQTVQHQGKYARWDDNLNRRETWPETVSRYIEFFREYIDENHGGLDDSIWYELQTSILNLDVLPSMRALMTAGPALKRDHMAGYNCTYLAIDRPHAFDEILYILCCGTGAGFSVEIENVSKLPEIPDFLFPSDSVIVVPDSKIGWATSLRQLIAMLYTGIVPKWDLSKVRPSGARLKTFGGRASGPQPLQDLFQFCVDIFKNAVGRKLTSYECHSIVCKIGDIVVVGGVRRAALISLSSPSDYLMRDAKQGQWWVQAPWLALANNSAAWEGKPPLEQFMDEWQALIRSQSGERGIYNRKGAQDKISALARRDPNYSFGLNPCVTGDTLVAVADGRGSVPFAELAKDGRDVPVYTVDHNGKAVVRMMRQPRITGYNQELVRVHLDDGSSITCTPNHKFLIRNGEYTEAAKLQEGDSLDILTRYCASMTNHRVVRVERLPNRETVYNGTVDDFHNYYIGGFISQTKSGREKVQFVNTKNCGEILLRNGQCCNLSQVTIRAEDTFDSMREKIRIATIIGTIQSTLTKFRYLSSRWQKNCEEERLLGVGMTGIMENRLLNNLDNKEDLAQTLREWRNYTIEINSEYAEMLGINPSTAITCIKPAGNSTQLIGGHGSGMHEAHAPFYMRRNRGNKNDPVSQLIYFQGVPCEDEVHHPESTWVFSYPMKAPEGAITRNDRTAIERLEHWLVFAENWCEHNPSMTVTVKEDEWLEVGAWVYKHFDRMIGVSFLPYSEHSYQQAPYQEITEEEYVSLIAEMPKSIDWTLLSELEKSDQTTSIQDLACSAAGCETF